MITSVVVAWPMYCQDEDDKPGFYERRYTTLDGLGFKCTSITENHKGRVTCHLTTGGMVQINPNYVVALNYGEK